MTLFLFWACIVALCVIPAFISVGKKVRPGRVVSIDSVGQIEDEMRYNRIMEGIQNSPPNALSVYLACDDHIFLNNYLHKRFGMLPLNEKGVLEFRGKEIRYYADYAPYRNNHRRTTYES